MRPYFKDCTLYYSEVLSIPILGDFIYEGQILLLNLGKLKIFFASGKNNMGRRSLFKKISQKFNLIYLRSHIFARDLRFLKRKKLVLDITYLKKPRKMAKEELYSLMWTLVFCKYVTRSTKNSLKDFLPANYPVIEIGDSNS